MQLTKEPKTLIGDSAIDSAADLSKLIARAAHDIRSPIAMMETGLHTIEQIIPKKNYWVFKMAIQRIRDITNNLLDRHRGGQEMNSVMLKPIVERMILHKQYEWQEKDFDLATSFSPNIEFVRVKASFTEISRMLSNLLNNAMEACEQHAKIQVCINKVDGFIEIKIADNGIGISPDKIKQCLEGESSKHAGMGLGLSSAKHYMERIDGNLFLTSEVGIGTTIILRFPAH